MKLLSELQQNSKKLAKATEIAASTVLCGLGYHRQVCRMTWPYGATRPHWKKARMMATTESEVLVAPVLAALTFADTIRSQSLEVLARLKLVESDRARLVADYDAMAAHMGHDTATGLHRALIENVLLNWWLWQVALFRHSGHIGNYFPDADALLAEKKLTEVHKRYNRSLETLAKTLYLLNRLNANLPAFELP